MIKLKYFKYLFIVLPLVGVGVNCIFNCHNLWFVDIIYISDLLDCIVDSVALLLALWGFPGVLFPLIFHWWLPGREASKQIFFSFPLSVAMIIIVWIIKGLFVMVTCGGMCN